MESLEEQYDAVVASEVIEHVDNQEVFLRLEIVPVLQLKCVFFIENAQKA